MQEHLCIFIVFPDLIKYDKIAGNQKTLKLWENTMKKKLVLLVLIVAIAAGAGLVLPGVMNKAGKETTITSSQLEDAINISQLSTAEFVYNGVAEKYNQENPDEIDCYIAYDANVKVGINMEEVTFKINEEKKTVTPVLPKIEINIATLDENSISYIPKNPDLSLKEVITLCKEDAMNEANHSDKLYETAQENLESVIEALLSPILEHEGYSIQW